MPGWLTGLEIAATAVLVLVNGFFVAAEFALVKVRPTRLQALVDEGRTFARSAQWLLERLDASLSACQLGITVASLALGWIGEPAVARLIAPLLHGMGIESEALLHGVAFIIAFTLITSLHLVVGEQAPKIFAIRQPETLALLVAAPLRGFYVATYPFLVALSAATSRLLSMLGVEDPELHEGHYTEDEIRVLLEQARMRGQLAPFEHQLLEAVFDLDERVCRQVMVPRSDVVYFDLQHPLAEDLQQARASKHTRYPVCDGSLDHVLGVVHIKDLFQRMSDGAEPNLQELMRTPHFVPESMSVTRLLRFFQAVRQHLALVVDEYGAVVGIVTLENVIEQIVGQVEDEFDTETPDIVPAGSGQFLVAGRTPVSVVRERLELPLEDDVADTISGFLIARTGRFLKTGESIQLDGALVEVVELRGTRAEQLRVTVLPPPVTEPEQDGAETRT